MTDIRTAVAEPDDRGRPMMATRASHKLGDVSWDEPDLAYVYGETETHYIGQWATGLGFVNVRFPKNTTRELTDDERAYYGTKLIDSAGTVRPALADADRGVVRVQQIMSASTATASGQALNAVVGINPVAPATEEPTRVVLIRPGDVLVISGFDLGEIDYDALSTTLSDFKKAARIPYVLFTEDLVEIGKLTADQLRDMLTALESE